MSKGALFKGPPTLRRSATVAAALGIAVASLPAAAQDSRSLQDMLLVAIRLGDVSGVRSIVAAGADVVKREADGKTAIDVAVDLGRFEIAEILVEARRRQRDASVQVAAEAPQAVPETPSEPVVAPEVVQPTAEAAPEIVPPPPAEAPAEVAVEPVAAGGAISSSSTPLATITAPGAIGGGATVEQLLALAHQLTLAAQALAEAQRVAAGLNERQVAEAPQAIDPAFAPKPGRKPAPIIEQASLAAIPRETAAPAEPPSDTVVVTPRRRSEPADELPALPMPPQIQPAAAMQPPTPPKALAPVRVPAASEDEDAENGLARVVRGVSGFFGMGDGAKSSSPSRAGSSAVRELPKRDRTNVPHVPARRASELHSQAAQPSLPPVKAMPVAPVASEPAPAPSVSQPPQTAKLTVRRGGGLNPFDPDNLPQGAVLPLVDPLAGNAPAAPPAQQLFAEAKAPPPFPLRPAQPQKAPPAVPPMPDAAQAAEPTAAFERRPAQPAVDVASKAEDGGILKDLASAVGLAEPDTELAGGPAIDPSDAERLATRRMPLVHLRPPLTDVTLKLGNSVAMAQRPLPRGVAEPDPCLKRSGGSIMFCVVPVDWHPRVDPAFSITTYLYQGSRAIARYDGGKATHYHTLFGSHQFDEVIKYFTARYGPPTDEWKRSIAPFDQPRQPNPTMVWRARDTRTNRTTILEVRRYDDTRNVFPDMEHGAVRLYAAGAERVFPVITGMDLMSIDWAARSDHNDGAEPALANTIRVGR